jgi:hypothetical protein
LLNAAGQKLSKQNQALPLDLRTPTTNLTRVLAALGLPPAPEASDCVRLLDWAAGRFRIETVPRRDAVAS